MFKGWNTTVWEFEIVLGSQEAVGNPAKNYESEISTTYHDLDLNQYNHLAGFSFTKESTTQPLVELVETSAHRKIGLEGI